MKKITRRSFLQAAGVSTVAAALAACSATDSTVVDSASTSESTSTETTVTEANTAMSDERLTFLLDVAPTAMTNLTTASTLQVYGETISASLFRYNDDTKTVDYALADSYEAIDDTHYQFHLREDAVYSDGTPVTSADVLYTLTAYKNIGVQDMVCIDPDNFEIIDDKNFILALTTYTLGWEYCLGQGTSGIYSEAAVEAAGGVDSAGFAPIGCGRYVIKEWKAGESLLVERNENYWDKDYVGYYKEIMFGYAADSASRTLAVRSGDADVANRIGVADYVGLQSDSVGYGWSYDCGVVNSVYFNNESGVCSDVQVREALCYAIDPEAVNQVLNLGLAEVEQGIWPSNFRFYTDYYGGSLYDPDKAIDLLAEIGMSTGLTINCLVYDAFKDTATVIQEQLRLVGVEVEVNSMDNATWTPLVRAGEYDITIGNTCIPCVNATMLNHVHPEKIGSSAYSIRVDNDEIWDAINTINSPDEADQAAGFEAMFDYVFGNYTVCGLCGGDKYMGVKQGITGLRVGNTYGYVDVTECYAE
ncbi:MAG: ABC transporter substrate-binding protein [Faecalibacterium sp.]